MSVHIAHGTFLGLHEVSMKDVTRLKTFLTLQLHSYEATGHTCVISYIVES